MLIIKMLILLSGGYGCLRAGFFENCTDQIYMITGVRGSGKTVMMTNIASEIM